MPALVLFGRRWLLGGDDLVIPALQLSLFHITWTVVLSIWASESRLVSDTACDSKQYFLVVVCVILGLCAVSSVLEPLIAWCSSQGSLYETRKRSKLGPLVYADLICSFGRVGMTIYGTTVLYNHESACLRTDGSSFNLVASYEALIWSMWAMIGGLGAFCILSFNFFPDYSDPEIWKRQCAYLSCWFCCVSGSKTEVRETFGRLGVLLGHIFRHTDLVFTDVLVIFYLSMMRQRIFRYAEVVEDAHVDEVSGDVELGLISTQSFSVSARRGSMSLKFDSKGKLSVGSTQGEVDPEVVEDLAYYMKYAFAAYGWMLYAWAHPGTGMVQLCCGNSCNMMLEALKGTSGPPLQLRRAPYLNKEAIVEAAHLEREDLLHVVQEGQGKDVLPYFIALDHEKEKIIIAIRGSMSFDDVVRDLKYEPADVKDWLDKADWCDNAPGSISMEKDHSNLMAHRGIFEASKATIESIESTGIIDRYISGPNAAHKDYSILVCGHSLGAGCAFFVGLYFRRYHKRLKCITFSPPGGLVSESLSELSRDWCISTVCGKECIPRLTLGTIEHLRDEMVHLGMYCKMSKISLLISWMTGYLWSDPDLFYSDENLPDEQIRWVQGYQHSLRTASEEDETLKRAEKFVPPGRVMYMKPTGKTRRTRLGRTKVSREYTCEWTTPEALVSNGIILSGRMMRDHFPDYSYLVLQKIARKSTSDMGRRRVSVFIDDPEPMSTGFDPSSDCN
jgi:sn1-specific diacylglycerol lipase